MKHDLEDRLEYIGPAGCWVLRHDNSITLMVRSEGRLAWDREYNALPCWDSIGPDDLCVDIGAYVGDSLGPMVERSANIVAVECQPDAFECLSRNFPKIELHLAAVGTGEMVGLHQGVGGNTGGRMLNPTGDIKTVTADSIIAGRSPKLVKIDVEGYECRALQGMQETITRCRPIILIEDNRAMAAFGGSSELMRSLLPGYRFEPWRKYYDELTDYIAWPD